MSCVVGSLLYMFLGELSKEEDVLEWLVQNKSTGDDEDVIEDVTYKTLNTLIVNIDNLAVLFCECSNANININIQSNQFK